ncbi:iron chaperone [Thalassotalea mangrovi]
MSNRANSLDDYISGKSPLARQRLSELRCYLMSVDEKAIEVLKWNKPALVNGGILFVYAAYKDHISLHPTPSVLRQLSDQVADYKTLENTIQFPISEPLPKALILKIAKLRLYEKNQLGIGWK